MVITWHLHLRNNSVCTEHENMGYFVEGINHIKVEEHLWRGIYVTTTGLSLVLSRAEYFVRLQNRLGSHISWRQLFISQVCWTPVISLVLECQYGIDWWEKTFCNFNMRNKSVMIEPVFWIEEQCWWGLNGRNSLHCKCFNFVGFYCRLYSPYLYVNKIPVR